MHRSVSLFASLALHAIILIIALWGFHTVRRLDHSETKIRISLLTPLPSEETRPVDMTIPPQPLPPEKVFIAPAPLKKTESRTTEPRTQPSPAIAQPEPSRPEPPKPAAAAAIAPAIPAITAEPVSKPAPPPPAVNVQAKYEEENLGRIRTILAERLSYPKNALRLRQQGEVIAVFNLSPSGEVSNLAISKSSDFELLDSAALRLIESAASEFPKPSKTVHITVPIAYKIR